MQSKMYLRTGVVMVMVLALVGLAVAVAAQDKPADNMQIMRDKIKADKKLVVAGNMELTESEAKLSGRLRAVSEGPGGDQPAHRQAHRELCRGLSGQFHDGRGGQETHR